jgi:hypothetical protein
VRSCGAAHPEDDGKACTKPEHPFGMHAHDPSATYWEGNPIPSPQDHKKNRALMEEIVLASGLTVTPPPKAQVPALEDRATREDSSGATSERQQEVLRRLGNSGSRGMTWKDLSMATEWHHGQSSGALSGLHKAGLICRLASSRAGCRIYVLPSEVSGRETEEHGGRDNRTYDQGYEEGYAQALRDLQQ